MNRLLYLLLAALAVPGAASATPITSTTCTSSDTTGCVTLSMYLYSTARGANVQVSGTWVGTLEFEGSTDNLTYYRLRADPQPDGVYVTNTVNNGLWYVYTAGVSWFRVRASSWTSGTANVSVIPTAIPPYGNTSVTGKVAVEATGLEGGPVVTNTSLSQPTLDFLNPAPRPCVIEPALRIALPPTPTPIPRLLPDGGYPALPGRTLLHAINSGDKDRIVCDVARSDGGLPDCTQPTMSVDGNGLPLDPNGGSHDFELAETVILWCLACVGSGTAELTYGQNSCAQ